MKLQWSDPKRSNHVPDLLDMPIDEFAKDRTARLAMDMVALRPIEEGEEILMDYGDGKHVLGLYAIFRLDPMQFFVFVV